LKKHLPLAGATILGFISVLTILLRIGFPHHRSIALGIYGIGWIFFIVALRRYRTIAKAAGIATGFVHGRLWTVSVGLVLLLVGYGIWVVFPVHETVFIDLDNAAVQELVNKDLARACQLIVAIDKFKENEEIRNLLGTDYTSFTVAQREELITFWTAYFEHVIALEQLKQRHRHFYQINYLEYPELNLKSFLTAYASFIAIYKNLSVFY